MQDLEELRCITQEARERIKKEEAKAAKVQAEQEKLEEIKREEEYQKDLTKTIYYINYWIKEAAKQGSETYIYDTGKRSNYFIEDIEHDRKVKDIKEHFKLLNPEYHSVSHKDIANYDMGTYDEYCTEGIIFRW